MYGRFSNATFITISVKGDPQVAEVFERARTATLAACRQRKALVRRYRGAPDLFDRPTVEAKTEELLRGLQALDPAKRVSAI